MVANNGFAQIDYDLNKDEYTPVDNINVLIGKNYSFSQILNDTSLQFTKQPRISVKGIDFYWIRYTVQNHSAYDKKFAIWSTPAFDSELFYFNVDKKTWQSVRGGVLVANKKTLFRYMPCVFKSEKATTFYVKVNVSAVKTDKNLLKPTLYLEAEHITVSRRIADFNWWLATVVIVLAFLIYNAYWYFMIKEKVYLYYLLVLAAGMIYITCVAFFLSLFTTLKSMNATIMASGTISYIPIELIIIKLSSLLIMFGFVQFTRSYLQSKTYLPQWDKILNILFQLFIVLALTFTLGEYFQVMIPNNIYALVVNTATLILIIVILIIGFKSYLQKRREANYYLSTLLLPLLLMLVLVFCLIVTTNNTGLNFLPNLAVLSITITFAVALVAKVNLIKEELNNEKLDKQKISASIAIEKERNIRLQEKIEYDKNEVAAAQHIKLLMKELHHRVKNNLQIVSSLLSLQSFRIKDQAAIDAVKEGQHRIEAMSLIHQKLYIQDNITQVNINEFITDIAESLMQAYGYNSKSFTLEIKVSEQLLEVDKAIPLSIIINELITNSFIYAYAGIENRKLIISFTKQFENAALLITDNGTGIDLDKWETNDGYGKELVHTFTEQLEGTLTLNVDSGTTFQIVFPL
jgi:two-component sensor histidine kinase